MEDFIQLFGGLLALVYREPGSDEGLTIPADEFLDRHRLAATDFGYVCLATRSPRSSS